MWHCNVCCIGIPHSAARTPCRQQFGRLQCERSYMPCTYIVRLCDQVLEMRKAMQEENSRTHSNSRSSCPSKKLSNSNKFKPAPSQETGALEAPLGPGEHLAMNCIFFCCLSVHLPFSHTLSFCLSHTCSSCKPLSPLPTQAADRMRTFLRTQLSTQVYAIVFSE